MRVLVACEESQAVTIAFRNKGHEAYSCDLLPCSGGYPEWHIKDDVRNVLRHELGSKPEWDIVIAFPPCTDLASSGARWFKEKQDNGEQKRSIQFFEFFTCLSTPRVAIENPVGIMSTLYRKPDQIIHPWQFGHKAMKSTCLWLKGLPLLKPTNMVGPPKKYKEMTQEELKEWTAIHRCPPGPNRAIIRSKTFLGISQAIADQWG